jgi:proline iminopeptidase
MATVSLPRAPRRRTGASARPTDVSLWEIRRYVEEVETVRQALGLDRVHLLGHSWGGWLGIEYAIHYPEALKSLILENTVGDIPHLSQELERLRGALGSAGKYAWGSS